MEIAVQLLRRNSYTAATVDQICEHAGVNKGTFYYLYKSKSDLAVAACERAWRAKRMLMEKCFDKKLPPLVRLKRYCDHIQDDQLETYRILGKVTGCPFCSIGSELSTKDENIRLKVEEIGSKSVACLRAVLLELIADKKVRSVDSIDLANQVYCYVIGVLLQAKIENNPAHLKRLKSGLWRLLDLEKNEPAPFLSGPTALADTL